MFYTFQESILPHIGCSQTLHAAFKNYWYNFFVKNNVKDLVRKTLAGRREGEQMVSPYTKAADTLISFKPVRPKVLFAQEDEAAIKDLASRIQQEESGEGKKMNPGAAYQLALSRLWEQADHSIYEDKVKNVDIFG